MADGLALTDLAERKFFEADVNGDGKLDATELEGMFLAMLVEAGHIASADERESLAVRNFISHEVRLAMSFDENWDDQIGFDEFVSWYNAFVDRHKSGFKDLLDPERLQKEQSEDKDRAQLAESMADNRLGFRRVSQLGFQAEKDLKQLDDSIQQTKETVEKEIQMRMERLKAYGASLEHGARWDAWRDALRERVFMSANEVIKYVVEVLLEGSVLHAKSASKGAAQSESERPPEMCCAVAVLMMRQLGSGVAQLWTRASSIADPELSLDEYHPSLKQGELWPRSADDKLTHAVYAALKLKAITHVEYNGDLYLLHPLSQLNGHAYGVVLNGPYPAAEELISMMSSAAGPVIERAHRFEEMRTGISDCLLFFYSRAANSTGASLTCRFEWSQYYPPDTRLQVPDSKMLGTAVKVAPTKKRHKSTAVAAEAKLSCSSNPEREVCESTLKDYGKAVKTLRAEQGTFFDQGEWQPFNWLSEVGDSYEQVIRWPKGARHTGDRELGTLYVTDTRNRRFDTRMVMILHGVGTLLDRFVETVSHVQMDLPNRARRELRSDLQALDQASSRYELPRILQRELHQTLTAYHGPSGITTRLMTVLASYTIQQDHVVKLVQAVLTLLGHEVDELTKWEDFRGFFNESLYGQLCESDFSSAHAANRSKLWRKAMTYFKGIDHLSLMRCSREVRDLLRWFEAVKFIHLLSIAITDELWELKQAKQKEASENETGEDSAILNIQRQVRGLVARRKSERALKAKKEKTAAMNAKAKVDTGLKKRGGGLRLKKYSSNS